MEAFHLFERWKRWRWKTSIFFEDAEGAHEMAAVEVEWHFNPCGGSVDLC
jgi:hypothetical protein